MTQSIASKKDSRAAAGEQCFDHSWIFGMSQIRILSATAPVPMLKRRTLQLCWCWILITKETVTLKLSELIIELSFYDFLGAQQVVVLIL